MAAVYEKVVKSVKRAASAARREADIFRCKISGRQIVRLLHIGKTGGTAVKYALRSCSRTKDFLIIPEAHSTTLRDVSPGEKVVFFLRDPVERFVSGFYSRQRQGRPKYVSRWSPAEAEAFERFSSADLLAKALRSGDAAEKAAAEKAMRSIQHVRDKYMNWFESEHYFCSRLDDIFFIGRQESLDRDFEELKKLLRLPASVSLPNDDMNAHRNPADVNRKLGQEAIESLREWYKDDYAFIRLCEERKKLRAIQ